MKKGKDGNNERVNQPQPGTGKLIIKYIGDPEYFVGVVMGDVRLDHRGDKDEHIIEFGIKDIDKFIVKIGTEGINGRPSPKALRMYTD